LIAGCLNNAATFHEKGAFASRTIARLASTYLKNQAKTYS
jgi:hypothetical protein